MIYAEYLTQDFYMLQRDKYIRYTVTTKYEASLVLEVMAKDPKEAAKLAGVVLMHFGQLRSYGEGTKPAVVEVLSQGLHVKFNLWSAKKNISERNLTFIVTEVIFVRKVSKIRELDK